MTRVQLVVRGRVQGVGFRWFVQEEARALDLAGWVRNASDGSVEVAAEGETSALRRLRDALGRGPRGAHVESLDETPASAEPLERPFRIMR